LGDEGFDRDLGMGCFIFEGKVGVVEIGIFNVWFFMLKVIFRELGEVFGFVIRNSWR
jgi:hypothetical protein